MNPNSFGTNPGHNNTHRASLQPTYQSADMLNAQFSFQMNQPFNSNQATKTQKISENNLLNLPRPQEADTKVMYGTGASFAKSSGNFGLSSLARSVDEPTQQKDKIEKNNIQGYNSNSNYTSFTNKNPGNTGRDQKMAASAIFTNSSFNNSEFEKFPAFNLGLNQNSSQSKQSFSSGTNQSSGTKSNESAKEKRQRELLEIKKQLDQLNKKMMINADKNKGNLKPAQSPQELRPQKNPMISQSAIFQTSTNFSNTFSGNQFSESKPSTPGLSIDQLYAQKKQNIQISNNQSKPNYETGKDWKTTITAPKVFEAQKKVEDNLSKQNLIPSSNGKRESSNISEQTASFLQKYQIPNYKPEPSYSNYKTENNNFSSKPSNPYGTETETKKTQPYSYTNSYTSTQNSNSSNAYKTENQGFTPLQPLQPVQPVQPLTQNKPPIYNFSKASQPAAEVAGGFKKKKGPVAEIIETKTQADMKQTIYPHTQTSTTQSYQSSGFGIRKTESVNYNDPTIPVPQLKQFKISDFVVGKKMGKGQFGEVLLVRHKETGWLCGLKVMNKKDIKDQDYVGQIARELSIQFYLMHRNVAQLYGYFEDQKNFYLLIQFCTGGQLLEKLKEQRRMNQRDVSIIIKQVCQGIDYIHKQQIIHRDIKPENILFNYGVVKISDFGWAVYRGFGMRKTASGSPLYYPPQIVKGEEYDDKIDVWCIGMMTYECILGKIPFKVYTEMDLGRIVSDQITFPSWVDVTDEAKDFILKTLKKKGQQRLQLKQMLRHPFITKHQQKELSPSILEQFKRVLS